MAGDVMPNPFPQASQDILRMSGVSIHWIFPQIKKDHAGCGPCRRKPVPTDC